MFINFVSEADELQQKIAIFEDKQKQEQKYNQKSSNLTIIYNIFAELLGGIITAFILNKIYTYFFGKNTIIFAILLIICSIAGLYNTMRYFWDKNNS